MSESILFNNSRLPLRNQDHLTSVAGDFITHYRAIFCNCSSNPTQGQPNCKACYGLGRYFTEGRRVAGTLTMASLHRDLRQMGVIQSGDLVFSPAMHDVDFATYDQAVLDYKWGQAWDGEVIVRAESRAYDVLAYGVRKLYRVQRVNPQTAAATEYVEGTDFTLEGRLLTWVAGRGPAPGTPYSLRYAARYDWVIYVPPAARFERGTPLGARIVLRMRHVAAANPFPYPEVTEGFYDEGD